MARFDSSKWSVDVVKRMFPKVSHVNIGKYFGVIEKAIDSQIAKAKITDPDDIIRLKLYAYATISVENASFQPSDEHTSRYNTLRRVAPPAATTGQLADMYAISQKLIDTYDLDEPFALYDDELRSKKRALGNTERGMGAKYKGRGFIQLTGRTNYVTYAGRASAPEIVEHPEKAGSPEIAARILAAYLLDNSKRILKALDEDNFIAARQVVNGKRALHHEKVERAYKSGAAAVAAPATTPAAAR